MPATTSFHDAEQGESSPTSDDGYPAKFRRNIDDAIMELEIVKVNALAMQPGPNDDTVIFLLPPPQAPEQSNQLYASIEQRYARPMFGKSAAFEQQAPMFYERIFHSTRQSKLRRHFANTLRRLGLSGFKYIVNSTPVTEGDEAIQAVLELNCPDGVLLWPWSVERFGCDKRYVRGTDTVERLQEQQPYSQIRHNLGIERLMLALHGYDPNFDSAVKVYTTAMLAKQFSVTGSRLQDHVVTWIRNPDNAAFIEVLPETTLIMADSLQSSALAVDSFAILVGEALLEKDAGIEHPRGTSIHGRPLYEVSSEEWQSRIEYATQSMEARVQQHFRRLTADDMAWVDNLPEYKKLLEAQTTALRCGCLGELHDLLDGLKKFVRACIFQVLCMNIKTMPPMGFDATGTVSGELEKLHPRIDYKYVWAELPTEKRILTRIFWRLLDEIKLNDIWLPRHAPSDVKFFCDWSMTAEGANRMSDMARYGASQDLTYGNLDYLMRMINKTLRLFPITALGNPIPEHMDIAGDIPAHEIRNFAVDTSLENSMLYMAGEAAQKFDVSNFFSEIRYAICAQADQMLKTPKDGCLESSEIRISNVLLCLTDAETRLLPLWAGGNDDGTGGVFNSEVPLANESESFTTHGPSIHVGADSREPSEYSFVSAGSNAPSSAIVHDGYSDTLDRRHVYAASDIASDIENTWTDVIAHRDQRALAGFNSGDRDDEVASIGSQNTETGPASDKKVNGTTVIEGFNDYSDLFNSDEEMDEEDGSGDNDQLSSEEEDDMDIIDASDLTEDEPTTSKAAEATSADAKPAGTAAATAPDEDDTIKILWKRDIDQELMNRP